MTPDLSLVPIGFVRNPLVDRGEASRQGDEGAPECTIELDPAYASAAADLTVDEVVLVLTWLHEADRAARLVRPRGDADRPLTGVFSTRSPDRPNPIGLHRVQITGIDGNRLRVRDLEAIDGTPVLDIKPVLGDVDER